MHKSRIGGFCIDCEGTALEAAAEFWSRALGCELHDPSTEDSRYRTLKTAPNEVYMIIQSVDHPSRVHLDIETDDLEAEASRLEALGARRLEKIRDWWVMEAPTGHRFCIVPKERSAFDREANVWD